MSDPEKPEKKLANVSSYFFDTRQGTGVFILIFIAVCVLIGVMPKTIRQHRANQFASVLYSHAVPEETRVVYQTAAQERSGGVTSTYALLIVQSQKTEEDLLAFYNDTSYEPAREGDTVTLKVYPLTESDLSVIQKTISDYREEGGAYYYIYLYSSPDAGSGSPDDSPPAVSGQTDDAEKGKK